MTIKKKILIGGLLLLIAFGSIGVATGLQIRDRQQAQVRRTVGAIADLERQRIISALAGINDRLQLAIRSEDLAGQVIAYEADPGEATRRPIVEALGKITPYLASIRAVSVVGPDGSVIADSTTVDEDHRPRVTTAGDITAGIAAIADGAPDRVAAAYLVEPGDARFVHVVPIGESGTAAGYVVAECDLLPIQELTDGSFVLGTTAETSLVQRTASAAQVINQTRFDDHRPFSLNVPFTRTDSPAVLALDGASVTYHHLTDYRNETVVASVRRIPNTPWGLTVKVDENEAYAGVERVLRAGAIGFGISGAISFAALAGMFVSITRRVRRVADSAEALSHGDLAARVGDTSGDELGRLARSFNKMADTLVSDMAARRVVEAELAHSARHDPLTNLPNRPAFEFALTRALHEETSPGSVAVLFCDLDDFKTVNDDLGHSAGDTLLREVTSRLRAATGHKNVLARFGGDEFVVVATGLTSSDEAVQLGERMARGARRAGHPGRSRGVRHHERRRRRQPGRLDRRNARP